MLKLKPEQKEVFERPSTRSRQTTKAFNRLKLQGQPLFKKKYPEKIRKRGGSPDPELFYEASFDPQYPIEEVINQLYELGLAEIAEPVYVHRVDLVPNDPELEEQYYLASINAFAAWDIATGSRDIVIGVVDTGLDTDHPDLVEKIWKNEDEIPANGVDDDNDGYVDNYLGYDFAGADTLRPSEDGDPAVISGGTNSHGTWVAGSAAASPNNGTGIAGTGYNCLFHATKHSFDNQREDDSRLYNPYAGVVYMAEIGVDIINLSWGSEFRSEIAQEVISFITLEEDILVVAAAGNASSLSPEYPAAYDNVVSVAALDAADRAASFTNRGRSVDIAAPGVAIFTTAYDNEYEAVSGTSFACPVTAGAAGILRAQFPELSAIQIGELLRVTANDSVYLVPGNAPRELGLGKLDLLAALTEQKPAIRMIDITTVNLAGQANVQGGDTVLLTADFINHLFPSTGQFEARMVLNSPYATVLEPDVTLGRLQTGEIKSNRARPFIFTIAENVPPNTRLRFRFDFSDRNYNDFQYYELLVNPSIITLDENRITTAVASNGRLGFENVVQQRGNGFIFRERNLLYEAGPIMGNSPLAVPNVVRGDTASDGDITYDSDFIQTEPLRKIIPGKRVFAEVTGGLRNRTNDNPGLNLGITYEMLASVDLPNDQFIIVEYAIANRADTAVSDFFAGLFADWDVGFRDTSGWNAGQNLGYVYNTGSSDTTFVGTQLLTGRPNYFPINNNPNVADNSFGLYDGFTDTEKFRSISSGLERLQPPEPSVTGPVDLSLVVAGGPYTIAPGDTVRVAFAMHATSGFNDLLASTRSADTLYNQIFALPRPAVAIQQACAGERAVLTATGGESYNWYARPEGGEPFFTGEIYTTSPLVADTVFYVASNRQGVESVRTRVTVEVQADPRITVLGDTALCAGSSLLLVADPADSWRWNTGDTTQQIEVTEAGQYFVTVSDSALDCSNTSDTVTITSLPGPVADFSFSTPVFALDEQDLLQLTDQSLNAVDWLWLFGDNTSSTAQNPEIRYEEEGQYAVTLIVVGPAGCTDTLTQQLTVLSRPKALPGHEVSLFPNPAGSRGFQLQISNGLRGEVVVEVHSATGQLVSSSRLQKQRQALLAPFSTREWPPGLYIVKVSLQGKLAVKRVLVE